MTEAGSNIVEPVPMPDTIRDAVAAFVAEHHVEEAFVKRKRDRAEPGIARTPPAGDAKGRAMTDRTIPRTVSWSAGRARRSKRARSADAPPSRARRMRRCRRAGVPERPRHDAKAPAEAAPKPEFDLASLPSLEFDHGGHRHPRLPRAGRAGGACPCGPSPRVVGRSGDPRLRGARRERLGLHRSDCDAGLRRAAGGLRRQEAWWRRFSARARSRPSRRCRRSSRPARKPPSIAKRKLPSARRLTPRHRPRQQRQSSPPERSSEPAQQSRKRYCAAQQ